MLHKLIQLAPQVFICQPILNFFSSFQVRAIVCFHEQEQETFWLLKSRLIDK